MLILDSNHLRVLRTPGKEGVRLANRLKNSGRDVTTTIINVHESISGWLSEINKAKTPHQKVPGYAQLGDLIDYYAEWIVLPFDAAAATQFDKLKRVPELRKIGTMDLQIAAIALCYGATILTSNIADFQAVPDLSVEDWLLDDPPII